jgi:hypothetical protein
MRYFILISFLSLCMSGYAEGYALLIGANRIKAGAYAANYSLQSVKGAGADVDKMREVLTTAGFHHIQTLIGEDATHRQITDALKQFKSTLKKGDVFVFYFSGHGDTLKDKNQDELPYLFDQALVSFDQYLVDDELNLIWKSFETHVKIYQIIDACYSGEIYKIYLAKEKLSPAFLKTKSESTAFINPSCFGLDGTQSFNMYYVAAAAKNRTSTPLSNGEGVLTNDIYVLFNKFRKEHKLENMSASEFFEAVCTGDFVFLKIYPVSDLFKNDYLFKL